MKSAPVPCPRGLPPKLSSFFGADDEAHPAGKLQRPHVLHVWRRGSVEKTSTYDRSTTLYRDAEKIGKGNRDFTCQNRRESKVRRSSVLGLVDPGPFAGAARLRFFPAVII